MNINKLKELYKPESVSREELLAHIAGSRFGVEVEFAGLTEREAAVEVFKAVGSDLYDRREKDHGGRFFDPFAVERKRQFDVKVNGMRYGFDRDQTISKDKCAELVTSPMGLDNVPDLMRILKVLIQKGAYATPTAAVHFHLDATRDFKNSEKGFENSILRLLCNSLINRTIINKIFPIVSERVEYCKPCGAIELIGMLHAGAPELRSTPKDSEIAVCGDTIEMRRFAFDVDGLRPQLDFALALKSCSVLGVKLPPACEAGISQRRSVGTWLDRMGVPRESIQKLTKNFSREAPAQKQVTEYMERYDTFSHGAEIVRGRGLTNGKAVMYNKPHKGGIK